MQLIDYSNIDREYSKVFISTQVDNLSYKESYDKIEKITYLFDKFNIKSGDRVAIMSSDDIETSLLFITCLLNGVTVSIMDSDTKDLKLNTLLKFLEPKAIFIDNEFSSHLDSSLDITIFKIYLKKKSKIGSLVDKLISKRSINYTNEIDKANYQKPIFKSSLDDTAYILFTSGSTSDPKGVEITYRNLSAHIKTLQKHYKIDKNSKILNILVLSHADGIIQGPILAFLSYITLYRPFKFEITKLERLIKSIKEEEITHFITVPTMLSLINQLGGDFASYIQESRLKAIISAGALLEEHLWIEFQDKFSKDIINVYGLTESVVGGVFTELGNKKHISTIGVPIDCEAKIIDEDGIELEDKQQGELLLSGTNIMKGYYKNQNQTDEVLKDGWLYTGDLAIREDGAYKIVGRKKSIILSGGFTISPEEITEVLNRYKPIRESIVFGLEDKIWGEEVVACVVVDRGLDTNSIEILEYCREYLEQHKVPKKVKFLDELPKLRSGKIDIREIIEKNFNNIEIDDSNLLDKKIFEIASENFQVSIEEIDKSSNPETISSWDSLGHLEFISLLESRFDISFSVSEMLQIENIEDAIRVIEKKIL